MKCNTLRGTYQEFDGMYVFVLISGTEEFWQHGEPDSHTGDGDSRGQGQKKDTGKHAARAETRERIESFKLLAYPKWSWQY